MRVLILILLAACSGGAPEIRPIAEPHGLRYDAPDEVLLIQDPDSWQSFIARQPSEQALRLRALEIDFDRESFVCACYMATSGSTKVRFEPAFRGDELVVEVRTTTPRGDVRTDVVFHRYAAVINRPNLRATLEIRP
ncbi:MAG: hypothetical protein ACYS0E_06515 [Planctomycetota bacterium]|jgi:hypothetical protein